MSKPPPSLTTYEKRRPRIATLLYCAFIAAVSFTFFRAEMRSPNLGIGLLMLPALFVGFMVVVAPVMIRFKQWNAYYSNYRPFDPDSPELPPTLGPRVRRAIDDLTALGFVHRGCF